MIKEILKQPMGYLDTNCYIIKLKGANDKKDFELIIDPGMEAIGWIKDNCLNPKAILNTHGHYDHVWSNAEVSKFFDIPIYTPIDDCFMLEFDHSSNNMPLSKATHQVASNKDKNNQENAKFKFDGILVEFFHFPGHTKGCSVVKIDNHIFSGDFIFAGTIGRSDFVFSNIADMKDSILRILQWNSNVDIHPGHGEDTTLNQERKQLENWVSVL
jgi:glyoxylase-like metal-dependent hydrolase (beta-lactamase superfamily II)